MKLIQDFLPENTPLDSKVFFKNGDASSYTIHWTGPFPGQSPRVVRDWWIKSGNPPSAHFIIKDEVCLQCWPITKVAFHSGLPTGNLTSIGIEVIPKNSTGEFSSRSIQTLKELFLTLPPKPLLRHYDWSGKDCPHFYLDEERWKQLKVAISPTFL